MKTIEMDLDLGMWLLYVDGELTAAAWLTDATPPSEWLGLRG